MLQSVGAISELDAWVLAHAPKRWRDHKPELLALEIGAMEPFSLALLCADRVRVRFDDSDRFRASLLSPAADKAFDGVLEFYAKSHQRIPRLALPSIRKITDSKPIENLLRAYYRRVIKIFVTSNSEGKKPGCNQMATAEFDQQVDLYVERVADKSSADIFSYTSDESAQIYPGVVEYDSVISLQNTYQKPMLAIASELMVMINDAWASRLGRIYEQSGSPVAYNPIFVVIAALQNCGTRRNISVQELIDGIAWLRDTVMAVSFRRWVGNRKELSAADKRRVRNFIDSEFDRTLNKSSMGRAWDEIRLAVIEGKVVVGVPWVVQIPLWGAIKIIRPLLPQSAKEARDLELLAYLIRLGLKHPSIKDVLETYFGVDRKPAGDVEFILNNYTRSIRRTT